MKLIYIAGPFRASTNYQIQKNVSKAEDACLRLMKQGNYPICPHLMTRNFQGELPDKFFLDWGLALLSACDAIYMLKNWFESEGARKEHDLAEDMNLEIIYE